VVRVRTPYGDLGDVKQMSSDTLSYLGLHQTRYDLVVDFSYDLDRISDRHFVVFQKMYLAKEKPREVICVRMRINTVPEPGPAKQDEIV
jgi:hypothetical protein